GKKFDDRVLVANPASRQPEYLSRADLEAVWDGRLVVVDKRPVWKDAWDRLIHAIQLVRLPKPSALAPHIGALGRRLTGFLALTRNLGDRLWQGGSSQVRLNQAVELAKDLAGGMWQTGLRLAKREPLPSAIDAQELDRGRPAEPNANESALIAL